MSIFSFVRNGGRRQQTQQTSVRRRTAAATRRSLGLACTEALESRRFLSATLVSSNFANTAAANGSSDQLFGPFISSNGRYVAFESTGTNISPNGTATQQVYLRDRLTGSSQVVSLGLTNLPAAGDCWVADMSPDGRYVLFFTTADLTSSNVDSQRVSLDNNGLIDLYVRDMTLGETFLVSGRNVPGTTTTSGGTTPAQFVAAGVYNDGTVPILPAYISDDGRFISYASEANGLPNQADESQNPLPASDNNDSVDLFVRDRQLNLTLLVTEGTQPNQSPTTTGEIDSFDMSADGGTIVLSTTYGLSSTDTNGLSDVYVRQVLTGTTARSSATPSTSNVTISADGSTIAYQHFGSFLPHVDYGTAPGYNGVPINLTSAADSFGTPALSADGRYVFFRANQTDLTAQPTSGANVFRYDRQTQIMEVASLGSTGGTTTLVGNANAGRLSVTPDGRYVAWQSDGTGADPAIANYGPTGQNNVYVRDMTSTHASLVNVSASDPTAAGAGDAWQPILSADGKVVLFVSDAPNLVTTDSNGAPDVFYSDVPVVVSPTLQARLSASDVTQGGATSYTFQVTYTGSLPIVISTIDDNDIIVVGPGGIVRQAQLVSVNSATNANAVTATYRIVPPGGSWDVSDNSLPTNPYRILLNNRQISDIQGNQLLAQELGTFQVNITIDTNVGPTFTASVLESAGTYTLRIQRNPADIGSVTATINYAVLSGTATYGVDFKLHDPSLLQAGTLPVALAPGEFYDLVFDIINDSQVEANENFQVVLSNITYGATTTFQRAIITINDDDNVGSGSVVIGNSTPVQPVPGVAGSTISILNGVPTVTAPETIVSTYGTGILPITISRADTGTTSVAATFNYTIYSTPSDTATSANFVAASGTLTFNAGEDTKDLLVQLLHDYQVTGDRTFTVVLTNATTGLLVGGTSIQVVVRDIDSAVQFANSAIAVTDDAGVIDVPVSRIGNITPGSKVRITFGGTAIAGQDYVVVGDGIVDSSGDITFAPGETSKVVHIQILSRPYNPGTFRTVSLGLANARALATSDPFSYGTVIGSPDTESVRIDNVDATAPQVAGVDFKLRSGRIAAVTVKFNEAVSPAGAKKLANYALFARTRDGRLGQLIPLAAARYNATTQTVTLVPTHPLALNQIYQVNVNSKGSSLTDVAGNRLDGDRNGTAGGAFSGIFGYGRSLSYADKDNDLVSFSLKGQGNLKITSLNYAVTVDVLNPDADKTSLLGSVTKRNGGNGKTRLSLLRLRGATFDANESKFEGDIRADV